MLAKRHQYTRLPADRTGPRAQWAADTRRRGITLVEMLVTVAVLVIMMTIIVQIFQAATGSVTAAQQLAQLDDQLRRIDTILRGDLDGATASFTPPNNPIQNGGYFEYGENEFADNQGEDSDDYLRFTAKAPAGRPFTGRLWVTYFGAGMVAGDNNQPQPITITSDYAEIIYFVRNGNLYRRVFLIVPEMQSAIRQAIDNTDTVYKTGYFPSIFNGAQVSWLGLNDLSARPAHTGNSAYAIMLNTLGDLTQRENRAFSPRWCSDFLNASNGYQTGQDGIPDDVNGDNNPDLYPSFYPGIVSPTNPAQQLIFAPPLTGSTTGVQMIASNPGAQYLAFPYIFPGAYSRAQVLSHYAYGWIHSPTPMANANGQLVQFDTAALAYLNAMNHNPIDVGDNLPTPTSPTIQNGAEATMLQTWWGFPTWRETLSTSWVDPTWPLIHTVGGSPTLQGQPYGLHYIPPNYITQGGIAGTEPNLLPPMADPSNYTGNFSIIRQVQQPFSDAAGQGSVFWTGNNNILLWAQSWEDDLILTNVRSFDVKAYDIVLANYGDLGWADDVRLYVPYQNAVNSIASQMTSGFTTPPYLAGTPTTPPTPLSPTHMYWPPIGNIAYVQNVLLTLGHEGRMPPLIEDNRLDYQNPNPYYISYNNYTPQYPAVPLYSSNVGDDNPGIVRLRRVWDSWSTEYSNAPSTGVGSTTGGFPVGPPSLTPPVYPSYPPPYPAALRGIQIQIRVADPTNQRVKSLTIRQDFTDKL